MLYGIIEQRSRNQIPINKGGEGGCEKLTKKRCFYRVIL